MTKGKKKRLTNEPTEVTENFRVAVKLQIQKFTRDDNEESMVFPSSLTSEERKFIHQYCIKVGLKTKSKGKLANRQLHVIKKLKKTTKIGNAEFEFNEFSEAEIVKLIHQCPLTSKERQDLLPVEERFPHLISEGRDVTKATGCLNSIIPQIPRKCGNKDPVAASLPIQFIRNEFLNVLHQNQVVLIYGDTGTGKTTQIPQFILDDCHDRKEACRVICTQPRRIAALSVSDRIAYERNEKLGDVVGYQIRLESKISLQTILLFSTNGLLLRTLMGGEGRLSSVTHIIVDEIHEREKLSDFLLIVLKNLLPKFPKLKLILMSATLDTNLFINYFQNCPVIKVPSKTFPVDEVYLEDILAKLEYKSENMKRIEKENTTVVAKKKRLNNWCSSSKDGMFVLTDSADDAINTVDSAAQATEDYSMLDTNKVKLIDEALSDAWLTGEPEAFGNLLKVISEEDIPVDYCHSETGASALMLSAGRGNVDAVEMLLLLGANANLTAPNNWNALDWAKVFKQKEAINLLTAHQLAESSTATLHDEIEATAVPEHNELLSLYQQSVKEDEDIDFNLMLLLIYYIHFNCDPGGILVFLPGYADLVFLMDKITKDPSFQQRSNYVLYTLHSSMQTSDQRKVFKRPPKGVRKIILSTNIAETSVTIDDVVYVIDCGKVKQKSYNSTSKVTLLAPVWISKASAVQRKGRAGRCRPGIVFRFFSRFRFNNMDNFQCPEILRTALHELCLHAKCLAPKHMSIHEFLTTAPEPPLAIDIKNSIELLENIDALNKFEELTELGQHLMDLPLDPTHGKMVLYSVVLKCLDPILTIVCSLSYKDPFTLSSDSGRQKVHQIKKSFATQSFSDHMVLLRAFQAWQKARSDGQERRFVQNNFLSSATLEMVAGMRSQILGQLRASGFVQTKGSGNIRDLNKNSENWAVVKAALFAGLYPNVIRVDRRNKKLVSRLVKKVKLHASSVLKDGIERKGAVKNITESYANIFQSMNSDWLIFDEMTKTNFVAFARSCTLVTAITVALFGGPARLPLDSVGAGGQSGPRNEEESDSECEDDEEEPSDFSNFTIDDWLSFHLGSKTIQYLLHLRQKWHALFLRRIQNPSKPWNEVDEMVLTTLVNVLSSQEQQSGFQQPIGIGQRPKPVVLNNPCNISYEFQNDKSFKATPSSSGSRMNDRGDSLFSNRPEKSMATYFLLKVPMVPNLDQFLNTYSWKFASHAEQKLKHAVMNGKFVIAFIYFEGADSFHCYGVVSYENTDFNSKGFFKISWIQRTELPFQSVYNAFSPWRIVDSSQSVNRDADRITVLEITSNIGDSIVDRWNAVQMKSFAGVMPHQPYHSYSSPSISGSPLSQNPLPSRPQYRPQHGRPIRGQRFQRY